MRKDKISGILILSILFLLPFGINARAQALVKPDYVGVEVGDEYTWKAELNFGNVDELLDNVRALLVDWKANLPSIDLLGFETFTNVDILELIATTYLDVLLPSGWESLNITELVEFTIKDYVVQFNSTFLSGKIPSNWLALNFSDFYNLAVDGINATLSSGWEDNPLPELYILMVDELNSTYFYGLIPTDWEELTLLELYESLIMELVPPIGESFALHMFLETMMPTVMTTEMLTSTISDIFVNITLEGGFAGLNATTLFDDMFFGLNQSYPPGGLGSENMAFVINFLGDMVNSTMGGYGALNGSEMLKFGIETLINMSGMPTEFRDLTITGWLDLGFTQAISMLDTMLIPEWDMLYVSIQGMGMSSLTAGLRVTITSIGTEIASYSGGPMGAPIGMDAEISLDMTTWIDMSDMIFGYSGGFNLLALLPSIFGGSLPTIPSYIVDPSTYSSVETALLDQLIFTGALIRANNPSWGALQTEITYATTGNPDAIELAAEWNSKGVLKSAFVKTDGAVVAGLTLIGEDVSEIPGYEIPIILGFTGFTIIAMILNRKKKNKSK